MSYIDLTEATIMTAGYETLPPAGKDSDMVGRMQGGSCEKGYSIPAGHCKNSPRFRTRCGKAIWRLSRHRTKRSNSRRPPILN